MNANNWDVGSFSCKRVQKSGADSLGSAPLGSPGVQGIHSCRCRVAPQKVSLLVSTLNDGLKMLKPIKFELLPSLWSALHKEEISF